MAPAELLGKAWGMSWSLGEPGVVQLPGPAALIDLPGEACVYWPSSPLRRVVRFRKNEGSLEVLPEQVGMGDQSHFD